MMRQLEKMAGHPCGRLSQDGTTKRCKRCNEPHPTESYTVGQQAQKRQNPYCKACREVVKKETENTRKRRREAFPY